jgi:hypothetical protein
MLCALLVMMLAVNAQSRKHINEKVAAAKAAGGLFESTSLLNEDIKVSETNKAVAQVVSSFSLFNYDAAKAAELIARQADNLTLTVSTAREGRMELELIKADILAPDFKAVSEENPSVVIKSPEAAYYHGVVKGIEESLAAITITGGEVAGFISIRGKGNYVLGKLRGDNNAGRHILYNENDMPQARGFDCGTKDDRAILPASVLMNASPDLANNPMNCTRIYVECDYQVVITQGSVAAANTYCVNLFNQAAALYENEFVHVVLSQVFILASTQNAVYGTNASTNLSTFQTLRAATFTGDLAIVVTTKTPSAGTIANGIAAGFAGLCNATRSNSMASMAAAGVVNNVPTYSRTVKVFTHELGHLFGSRHTHACVWNGTSTAIDGCPGFTEGGCPVPPIPATSTIMSYGDTYATSPIDFTLGFGPQPGNLIRNNAHNAVCLANCTPSIDLWSKDESTDAGIEPNPYAGILYWDSPDIWVRNINDGIVNQVHQNPEFGQTNYLYVRVRNRGSLPSVAMSNVKLSTYWAKASAALSWTYPWLGGAPFACGSLTIPMGSPIGTLNIPSVPAGGSVILTFPWAPPNFNNYACYTTDKSHFCLLARIQTTNYSPFGMAVLETTNLWQNVKNNNNIVWKNITVVNNLLDMKPVRSSVLIAGRKYHQQPVLAHNLTFNTPGRQLNDPLIRHATVTVDLGKFADRWRANGAQGKGIKMIPGGTAGFLVQLIEPNATIDKVDIADDETNSITMEITKTDQAAKGNYNIDMALTNETYSPIGGENFEFRFNEFTNPVPTAKGTKAVAGGAKAGENDFTAIVTKGVLKVIATGNVSYNLELTSTTGTSLATKRFNKQTELAVTSLVPGTYIVWLTPATGGERKAKQVIIN